MKTSKQFFTQLREGEEYYNCFMSAEVFNGIDFELQQQIVVSSVRQKNSDFEKDEQHRALLREVAKAKSKLQEYEFNLNTKK